MEIRCAICSHASDVDGSLFPEHVTHLVCSSCNATVVALRVAAGEQGAADAARPLPLQCQQCQTRFTLKDERLVKDGATSTCKKCGARIAFLLIPESLEGLPAPPEAHDAALQTPVTHHLKFWGSGGTLLGIHIVNMCLTLLTLGIYYFWAKTRVREYLFSQSEFGGDRFVYHGTGKELFLGLLKAGLVFGLPYVALTIGPEVLGVGPVILVAANTLASLVFVSFFPVALAGARRYRLSRTSWRGIRFSFRGRTWEFVKLFWKGIVLTGLTLGLYYPFFDIQRQTFWVSHSYVGNKGFAFDGKGKELFGSFLAAVLLLPFTLGLSWLWYSAKRQRYFWNQTTLGKGQFICTITAWPLFQLKLGNLLLLVLTLGVAWPWTTIRNIRFLYDNLALEVAFNLDTIVQDPRAAAATGEGLADYLDTGFDLA